MSEVAGLTPSGVLDFAHEFLDYVFKKQATNDFSGRTKASNDVRSSSFASELAHPQGPLFRG